MAADFLKKRRELADRARLPVAVTATKIAFEQDFQVLKAKTEQRQRLQNRLGKKKRTAFEKQQELNVLIETYKSSIKERDVKNQMDQGCRPTGELEGEAEVRSLNFMVNDNAEALDDQMQPLWVDIGEGEDLGFHNDYSQLIADVVRKGYESRSQSATFSILCELLKEASCNASMRGAIEEQRASVLDAEREVLKALQNIENDFPEFHHAHMVYMVKWREYQDALGNTVWGADPSDRDRNWRKYQAVLDQSFIGPAHNDDDDDELDGFASKGEKQEKLAEPNIMETQQTLDAMIPLLKVATSVRSRKLEAHKDAKEQDGTIRVKGNAAAHDALALPDALLYSLALPDNIRLTNIEDYQRVYDYAPEFVLRHSSCSRLLETLNWNGNMMDFAEHASQFSRSKKESFEKFDELFGNVVEFIAVWDEDPEGMKKHWQTAKGVNRYQRLKSAYECVRFEYLRCKRMVQRPNLDVANAIPRPEKALALPISDHRLSEASQPLDGWDWRSATQRSLQRGM